ncbi:uncharacterized protein [Triticum aestivum]|uniref:uncharacterized protein n=1 Tax=Triticum aestivum TaxID=4565 RepID=UPI001D02DE3D|nr:uncharacterized protein LOC123186931 [Triticum aestivum]
MAHDLPPPSASSCALAWPALLPASSAPYAGPDVPAADWPLTSSPLRSSFRCCCTQSSWNCARPPWQALHFLLPRHPCLLLHFLELLALQLPSIEATICGQAS